MIDKKKFFEFLDRTSSSEKHTNIGDEYDKTPYKLHLCRDCKQLVVIHEDKMICPNCNEHQKTPSS